MNRREGYYWCKLDGKWDIFTWCENWYDGMQNRYEETDFEEIDERRITREVQKTSIEKLILFHKSTKNEDWKYEVEKIMESINYSKHVIQRKILCIFQPPLN